MVIRQRKVALGRSICGVARWVWRLTTEPGRRQARISRTKGSANGPNKTGSISDPRRCPCDLNWLEPGVDKGRSKGDIWEAEGDLDRASSWLPENLVAPVLTGKT